jgi:hypothetical protein
VSAKDRERKIKVKGERRSAADEWYERMDKDERLCFPASKFPGL